MERVSKIYTLKNGYRIYKMSYYTGVETVYYWVVDDSNGARYKNCGSYDEAYEIASHLVVEEV